MSRLDAKRQNGSVKTWMLCCKYALDHITRPLSSDDFSFQKKDLRRIGHLINGQVDNINRARTSTIEFGGRIFELQDSVT